MTRVFEPGHKWDYTPILESPQGVRKSTFIRTLAMHDRWSFELHGDFEDARSMVELMERGWIGEMPELQGFSKADVQTLKGFMT